MLLLLSDRRPSVAPRPVWTETGVFNEHMQGGTVVSLLFTPAQAFCWSQMSGLLLHVFTIWGTRLCRSFDKVTAIFRRWDLKEAEEKTSRHWNFPEFLTCRLRRFIQVNPFDSESICCCSSLIKDNKCKKAKKSSNFSVSCCSSLIWELFYLVSCCLLSHRGQRSGFRVGHWVAPPELTVSGLRSHEVTRFLLVQNGPGLRVTL